MFGVFGAREWVQDAVRDAFPPAGGSDERVGRGGLLLYGCEGGGGWRVGVCASLEEGGQSKVACVEGGEVGR